jgi:hypothetical protein
LRGTSCDSFNQQNIAAFVTYFEEVSDIAVEELKVVIKP